MYTSKKVISRNSDIMEPVSSLVFWDSSYSFSLKTLGKAIYLPAAVGNAVRRTQPYEYMSVWVCIHTNHHAQTWVNTYSHRGGAPQV